MPFQPGQSGNPGGKPKIPKPFLEAPPWRATLLPAGTGAARLGLRAAVRVAFLALRAHAEPLLAGFGRLASLTVALAAALGLCLVEAALGARLTADEDLLVARVAGVPWWTILAFAIYTLLVRRAAGLAAVLGTRAETDPRKLAVDLARAVRIAVAVVQRPRAAVQVLAGVVFPGLDARVLASLPIGVQGRARIAALPWAHGVVADVPWTFTGIGLDGGLVVVVVIPGAVHKVWVFGGCRRTGSGRCTCHLRYAPRHRDRCERRPDQAERAASRHRLRERARQVVEESRPAHRGDSGSRAIAAIRLTVIGPNTVAPAEQSQRGNPHVLPTEAAYFDTPWVAS